MPSEAEWEKAARGGLVGARYPWGDEAPSRERAQFGAFEAFDLGDRFGTPPNGYGLYGMAGGVWEWTSTRYDALAYSDPHPDPPEDADRVIRGGSWTDCAEALRVSFRGTWSEARDWARADLGVRLARWELG